MLARSTQPIQTKGKLSVLRLVEGLIQKRGAKRKTIYKIQINIQQLQLTLTLFSLKKIPHEEKETGPLEKLK